MAKKSAAQIRRMQKRALKRGEEYVAPEKEEVDEQGSGDNNNSEHAKYVYDAAQKLKEALDQLEENSDNLNSKERRSAKRKAEAIALEEANKCHGDDDDENDNDKRFSSVDDLLQWYEENKQKFQQKNKQKGNADADDDRISKEDRIKFNAMSKYQATMKDLEQNREELNSKDRRSAKRKAEAIACEESSMDDIEKLLIWYEQNKGMLKSSESSSKKRKANDDGEESSKKSKKSNPYILFIGQIPYDTTSDELLQHFQKYMGKELIQQDAITIRIPNDEKAKGKKLKKVTPNPDGEDFVSYVSKNKGYAFCEFQDPEVMYECLKLHHTPLDGRRINVLRSAGGGKAARTETHKQRKKEQDEYISAVVDKIIEEHVNNGSLKEGELDEGAMLLCKRRSAAVVEMALSHYIEQKVERESQSERPLDNPSAFFSSIICRVTDEGGLFETKKKDKGSNGSSGSGNKNQKKKSTQENKFRARDSSVFTQSGVDMSISEKSGMDGDNKMSQLFPSSRGRGRGRGAYMR